MKKKKIEVNNKIKRQQRKLLEEQRARQRYAVRSKKKARRLLQRRIARLLMSGLQIKEIALRLNRSPGTIRQLIARESFDIIANDVEQAIHKTTDLKINGLFELALNKMKTLLTHEDPEIVGEAVDRVLRLRERRFKEIEQLQQQDAQQQQQNEQNLLTGPEEPALQPEEIQNAIQNIHVLRDTLKEVMTAQQRTVVEINPDEKPEKTKKQKHHDDDLALVD